MITKQQLKELEVGESLSYKFKDKLEVQRIRNYAMSLKSSEYDFTVRTSNGIVTATRISTVTPERLTDQLKAMSVGQVIHPCSSKHLSNVKAVVDYLGGGWDVSLVCQVIRTTSNKTKKI